MFYETINIDGKEYDVDDYRDDKSAESVYVICRYTDVIDDTIKYTDAIRKDKNGVIEFIRSNPLKYEENEKGETEFGSEWYGICRYNIS